MILWGEATGEPLPFCLGGSRGRSPHRIAQMMSLSDEEGAKHLSVG